MKETHPTRRTLSGGPPFLRRNRLGGAGGGTRTRLLLHLQQDVCQDDGEGNTHPHHGFDRRRRTSSWMWLLEVKT